MMSARDVIIWTVRLSCKIQALRRGVVADFKYL